MKYCECPRPYVDVELLGTSTLADVVPHVRQNFRALLDKNEQHWVPILDPPIHIKQGYGPYDSGIAAGVFVKDITGQPYTGQVGLLTSAISSSTL